MKRLVLVRHGETVWHAENRYAGSSDIALTPRGEAQAEALARWAADAMLDAVWASPLSRAQATARPSAVVTGLPLRTEARLRELHFGRGEGLSDKDMQAAFPAERKAFRRDPVAHHLPEGEHPIAAAERGAAALSDIADALHRNGRALVVAHNTLLRLVLCHTLGVALSRYRDLFPQLANGTLTELGCHDAGFALLAFNAPLCPQEKGRMLHG